MPFFFSQPVSICYSTPHSLLRFLGTVLPTACSDFSPSPPDVSLDAIVPSSFFRFLIARFHFSDFFPLKSHHKPGFPSRLFPSVGLCTVFQPPYRYLSLKVMSCRWTPLSYFFFPAASSRASDLEAVLFRAVFSWTIFSSKDSFIIQVPLLSWIWQARLLFSSFPLGRQFVSISFFPIFGCPPCLSSIAMLVLFP